MPLGDYRIIRDTRTSPWDVAEGIKEVRDEAKPGTNRSRPDTKPYTERRRLEY